MIVKALIRIRHNEKVYEKGTELILTKEETEKLKGYVEIIERDENETQEEANLTREEIIEILVSERGMDSKDLKKKKLDELKELYKEI